MPTRGRQRTKSTLYLLVAALVLLALWWGWTDASSTSAHAEPALPSDGPAAASPAGTAAPGSAALREVRSPKAVADDIALQPEQCHVRVLDAATGLELPDATCTPGAVDPAVTQANLDETICTSGYTSTVRPSSSSTGRFKSESLADYGIAASKTTEYDHLVSLELGGANSVSNLWPEPNRATATGTTNPKDAVENRLHKAVCARQVTLAAAQHAIATNWTTAEQVLDLTK